MKKQLKSKKFSRKEKRIPVTNLLGNIKELDFIAKKGLKNARIVDVTQFEYPNFDMKRANAEKTIANVIHYRIGKTSQIVEVGLGPNKKFENFRTTMKYKSPYNEGVRGKFLQSHKISLSEIKKLANKEGSFFLEEYPNSIKSYYLTSNYFNFANFEDKRRSIKKLKTKTFKFDGPLWINSFYEPSIGDIHFSMFNANSGKLLYSTTMSIGLISSSILPALTWEQYWRIAAVSIKINAFWILTPLAIASAIVGPAGGGLPWLATLGLLVAMLLNFIAIIFELLELFDPDTRAEITLRLQMLERQKDRLDRARERQDKDAAEQAEEDMRRTIRELKNLIENDSRLPDDLKNDIKEMINEMDELANSIPN